MARLSKRGPHSLAEIYLGHLPFHACTVAVVLNPEIVNVSPQFHVVFDDEISTVPFMREGTIPPNLTDLVQHISESDETDNINLKDNWFTPDF